MRLHARTILKLIVPFVLVALVQPAIAVQVRRVVTGSGVVLRLRGDVTDGDYRRLKDVLQNGSVVGLEIRSGGGSLEAGLDIARVVRDMKLVVYASKECDSVCAFIFFAARERFMGRDCRIGVHSVSNERGKEDADSARDYHPDVAASGRTRSTAFCHRQDCRDASDQDHLSRQSRSGRAECTPDQSLPKHLCRCKLDTAPAGQLGFRRAFARSLNSFLCSL